MSRLHTPAPGAAILSSRSRHDPDIRRAAIIGSSVAGLAVLAWLMFIVHGNGFDTYSYWRIPHGTTDLYAGSTMPGGPPGTFRYSPAFAQLVSPLWVLPWGQFLAAWTLINLAAFVLIARRWSLVALAFVPVPFELFDGNVHLLIALAIVVGFRWPAAWAFILLTKVTPGVGLLWFVVRREWHNLVVALGATALVVAISASAFGPTLWGQWFRSLEGATSADWTPLGWVPLPVRLALAAALVAWGASRGYRWVLPFTAVLSLPSPWMHSFSILVATIPLGLPEDLASAVRRRSSPAGVASLGPTPTVPPRP